MKHQHIVNRINRNRFDEMEGKATPWFWIAMVLIATLVMVV